jgi:hypothetical protein
MEKSEPLWNKPPAFSRTSKYAINTPDFANEPD